MTDRQSHRERELFEAALGVPADRQAEFLREACSGDRELEQRLLRLLDAHHRETAMSSPPEIGDTVPEQIGPYRILESIGEGGMGVVYIAEQSEPVRRRVALKIIKAGMESKEIIARFESERQALALMNHPNIARILDVGATEQRRPYFVMEYVPGVPISEYCDGKGLEIDERLRLLRDVCDAVQHAHQKGVVHRDLKPSNILVSEQEGEPTVKVIDFGIAKATGQRLGDLTVHTRLGSFVGTPEYMSPEQAQVTGLDIDTRADVYSLGAVLYQLLVGTPPFRFEPTTGPLEIQRAILEQEPVAPSTHVAQDRERQADAARRRATTPEQLVRELRGELDWVTLKALEKDRGRRYSAASELGADLARYLADQPVSAGAPSAAHRIRKFTRRNRLAIALFGAILFGILGAAAGLFYALIESNQRRTEVEAALLQSDAVTDFLSDMLAAVDPAEEGGDVAVREVLDIAAGRIDVEFADQPAIAARLRSTIGESYRALGKFELAEEHLQAALGIRRELFEESSPEVLYTRGELAWLEHLRGNYDQAEVVLADILEQQSQRLGAEHPTTVDTVNRLASNFVMQERPAEVIALLEDRLDMIRRALGGDHPTYLKSTTELALAYVAEGRYDEAEPLLVAGLEADRRRHGDVHVDTLAAMQNLASLYRLTGRLESAEPLYAASVESARTLYGDEHPNTLRYMANLALLYTQMERYDDAEPLSLTVLELRRRLLGHENPSTVVSALNTALLLNKMGRHRESETLAAQTAEIASRTVGEEHLYTLAARSAWGAALLGQGRAAEAEPVLARIVVQMKDTFSPTHWRVGVSLVRHGAALRALDRVPEAEARLLEGYEVLTGTYDPEHDRVQDAARALVDLYEAGDRAADAARWRAKLIED